MDKSKSAVSITVAESPDEKEAIWRFRYAIYVEEMGKLHLASADHGRRWIHDSLDESGRLYAARAGGELVATLRINRADESPLPDSIRKAYGIEHFRRFPAKALSFSSRLMVAPGLRGSAALHHLLSRAYADGLEAGVLFDFCHCAPALVELYEHLGYRAYTDNFLDPDVGYRVPMVLVLRDAAFLESIHSPFWRRLKEKPLLWQDSGLTDWLGALFPVSERATEWRLDEDSFWHFLTDKLNPDRVNAVPFLEGLSEEERRHVLESGAVLACKPGDAILRAGDVGSELFVLLSGLVAVRQSASVRPLAVFEPGQVFGEIAFIADITRTADVVALEASEVLVVSQTYLRKMMKASPELAAKLLFNLSRILCERLAFSTHSLPAERDVPASD
jgi:hypothetical protein